MLIAVDKARLSSATLLFGKAEAGTCCCMCDAYAVVRAGDQVELQTSICVIKVLLQLGASIMVKDCAGNFPLTLATTLLSGVIEDEIAMLEEAGIYVHEQVSY